MNPHPTNPLETNSMDPNTITSEAPVPEGMIRLPSRLVVQDDAHGRLMQLYEEAYELHNDDLLVSIVGREPFRLHLGGFIRESAAGPRIAIADDIVVLRGGLIESPRIDGSGRASWCGGHSLDGRVIVRFNLDGRATTFEYANPLAFRYEDHTMPLDGPAA